MSKFNEWLRSPNGLYLPDVHDPLRPLWRGKYLACPIPAGGGIKCCCEGIGCCEAPVYIGTPLNQVQIDITGSVSAGTCTDGECTTVFDGTYVANRDVVSSEYEVIWIWYDYPPGTKLICTGDGWYDQIVLRNIHVWLYCVGKGGVTYPLDAYKFSEIEEVPQEDWCAYHLHAAAFMGPSSAATVAVHYRTKLPSKPDMSSFGPYVLEQIGADPPRACKGGSVTISGL